MMGEGTGPPDGSSLEGILTRTAARASSSAEDPAEVDCHREAVVGSGEVRRGVLSRAEDDRKWGAAEGLRWFTSRLGENRGGMVLNAD